MTPNEFYLSEILKAKNKRWGKFELMHLAELTRKITLKLRLSKTEENVLKHLYERATELTPLKYGNRVTLR
jgi:hypothetical protein